MSERPAISAGRKTLHTLLEVRDVLLADPRFDLFSQPVDLEREGL